MASDRETTIRTGIHQICLASVHGECEEGMESEENSLFNHLVPGSIRRDYRVIGENDERRKVDTEEVYDPEGGKETDEEKRALRLMQNVQTCIILSG